MPPSGRRPRPRARNTVDEDSKSFHLYGLPNMVERAAWRGVAMTSPSAWCPCNRGRTAGIGAGASTAEARRMAALAIVRESRGLHAASSAEERTNLRDSGSRRRQRHTLFVLPRYPRMLCPPRHASAPASPCGRTTSSSSLLRLNRGFDLCPTLGSQRLVDPHILRTR
ncbi:hypothetical protein BDY21DRAFT_136324 [Lineolata rhizophorae]|uniref:Uncharacterized protein n=1 Tax=Lineolata rhizophorae TaxID=578093 RepID=A0A6A6PB53_9PEZI|nr:hypothetical protein BDY21DRAFT_136324 [Lineolata rhizophorae]